MDNLVDYSVQLGETVDEFTALLKIAQDSNRSLSQVVRVALRNYIASKHPDNK